MIRVELPAEPASASVARRAVREACAGSALDVDTLELCTSELVTNALLHGRPPIALDVLVTSDLVRVEVHDGGTFPVERRRPVQPDTLSGRGLDLVEQLARRWGSDLTDGGKVTWFEL